MIPIDKTEPQDARTSSIDKAIDDARDVLKRLEGLAKAEEERHEHTQQVFSLTSSDSIPISWSGISMDSSSRSK